jgi:hypothetical protein
MEQWPGGDGQGYARFQQAPYAAFGQPVLAAAAEGVLQVPPYGYVGYVKTPYGLQLAQLQALPGRAGKDAMAQAYAPAAHLAPLPVGVPFLAGQDHLAAAQLAAERPHPGHMNPLQQRSQQLQQLQLQLQQQQQQLQQQQLQLLHQLQQQQRQQHQQQLLHHHPGAPRSRQAQAAQLQLELAHAHAQQHPLSGVLPSSLFPPSPPRALHAPRPPSDPAAAAAAAEQQQQQVQAPARPASSSPPPAAASSDPMPDSWSWLMEGVLQIVLSHLRSGHVRNFRAVCRHWKAVADGNTMSLAPRMLRPKAMTTLFPRLHTLILTNCLNVRNRDLFVLAQSAWSLRTLTVGDDMNKPWVTNRGLSSIAKMTSLTALSLHDCNSVTNNGLTCLNKLRALGHLSLKGCRKITNSGLEVLQHNTGLTSLNVFGCVRISDKGLLPLVALPLRSLHL